MGFESYTAGVSVGLEARIGDNFSVGVAGGVSRIETDFDNFGSEGRIDSAHGALFAEFVSENWHGSAVGGTRSGRSRWTGASSLA